MLTLYNSVVQTSSVVFANSAYIPVLFRKSLIKLICIFPSVTSQKSYASTQSSGKHELLVVIKEMSCENPEYSSRKAASSMKL